MGEQHVVFSEHQLERPNWFGGRLLTAADLDLQQSYVRERARRHNRLLHGWGVATGLDVTAGLDGQLYVSAGFALDAAGNEIVVPDEVRIDAQVAGLATVGATSWVSVRWDECRAGEVPAPRPNDPPVAAAWREDFEIAVLADPPPAEPTAGPPSAAPWVLLATVTWDAEASLSVDSSVRRALPQAP